MHGCTTHAGGTVVVAVALSDGLVLAADSRLTITLPKGVTPEYKVASDYAPKLFNIGQVAIASFGDAFVSARSIASYISELEASLKGSPPANVDEMTKQFETFFVENSYDDHSLFESIACVLAEQARVALELCPTCEKPIGQHTPDEIRACADKQRDEKLKDVRCPICNKLVLEHSHSESVACTEKHREQEQGEPGV
jgi:hypothetical protein